ncbi:MAG: UDP-glucose/GDP-mannose dehydrogenase family protein [Flavobacteriales bacterium]
MNIAVIGTGYVGLVSSTCLAETGNCVSCVDIDEEKVALMQRGEVPIYEPGLEALFHRNIEQGRLHFTTDMAASIREAEIIMLALPTPPNGDGSADLSHILQVAGDLGRAIHSYKVIVDKSTVPVGTAEWVRKTIAKSATVDFDVVSNPEFLREGFAVTDFMKPDRIVIGASSTKAARIIQRLYKPYVARSEQLIVMDEKSAELAKYAANSFLATKITFMNELANYAERVGANVDKIRLALGADARIGKRFLCAGIGFGGSCFPKDVKALIKSGREARFDFKILSAVEGVNARQRLVLVDKITKHFDGDISKLKIAVWGLAFKPDTDDIREAASLYMIEKLLECGARVAAYDPVAMKNAKKQLGDRIDYAKGMYGALGDADALVVATEWSVFSTPDFARVKNAMKKPLLFDGRNIYDPAEMEDWGFTYYSIGRKPVLS